MAYSFLLVRWQPYANKEDYTMELLMYLSLALLIEATTVFVGLGRIVPLHQRSSTLHQIHECIRSLFFWNDSVTDP